MVPDDQQQSVEVPLAWTGLDAVDTFTANEFLITPDAHDDLLHLTVGLVSPPVFMGSDEEQIQQLRDIRYVTVRALGRFALTHERARRLAEILSESLERYNNSTSGDDSE